MVNIEIFIRRPAECRASELHAAAPELRRRGDPLPAAAGHARGAPPLGERDRPRGLPDDRQGP